ncbi:hypothetical protein [Roseovarius autotrophicus]|uniref:hypothetical protein n=1 Tax=Roseovarius autotrophicus TaxID=2824121 RepID=UPI001B38F11B|nr:hypothetical protein [Roseovarius autotrophicus]
MKRLALILALTLPAAPAPAQEGEGRSLMEEGARLFWEGIRREMGPALDSLRERADEIEPAIRDFVERMGPALGEMMDKIGDLSAYHPPEVLPNGDIIIRRKTPQELKDDLPEGEVEI